MKIDSLPIPIRALAYTVFILGSIHLAIAHVSAFIFGDWQQINHFHILAIDILWPELAKGIPNMLLSQIFWVVPIFWFWYFKRQKGGTKGEKSAE